KAIEIANDSRSVVRVVVGNEAIYRSEITPEALIEYLDRVRAAIKVPVTTSEPWRIWRVPPERARHVDLFAAHGLRYWGFVTMEDSTECVRDPAKDLRQLSPKKPRLRSDVGWPSNGRMRGGAEASPAGEGIYLPSLVNPLQ